MGYVPTELDGLVAVDRLPLNVSPVIKPLPVDADSEL
jgi:hypothetical protein